MRQSVFIIDQTLNYINGFNKKLKIKNIVLNPKFIPVDKQDIKYSMESLIHHFKFFSQGLEVNEGETFSFVEAPKGEFGVYLKSYNLKKKYSLNKPFRCRIKAPGFLHLQGLDYMSKNLFLADLVTIIGTQDIVFGEIDR
jgi:NADH:ubiquinone oxidoreductase subunit D